jgi:ferric-dicitrate binding protein FerR (iron transport regulator)
VGASSRAAIALDNGSVLRLDQQTVVALLGSPAEQRTAFTLVQGAAYVLSRKPRLLDVDTAYANASIEGTEFLLRVLADRTLLDVFEGRVIAENEWGRMPDIASECEKLNHRTRRHRNQRHPRRP